MKKLSASAYRRARDFVDAQARPLERALLAHAFEGGSRDAVLAALDAYQNPDGGFGHAIEPDVRLPESSGIGTLTGLDVLREVGVGVDEARLQRALAWVVARYDPELPGWRCVPPSVDDFPHAGHWSYELHRPGGSWPHILIPGARLLAHLEHWRSLAPPALLSSYGDAFRAHVETLEGAIGGDGLYYASTVDEPRLREKLRDLARQSVSRDPAEWTGYVNKPLKLAPAPSSIFADALADELRLNLDWEIDHQSSDGSWEPNWSWRGAYPADWEVALREWRGELTRKTLRSLRAYGRIEGF